MSQNPYKNFEISAIVSLIFLKEHVASKWQSKDSNHDLYHLWTLILFCFSNWDFLEQLNVDSNTEGKVQRFLLCPLPPHLHSVPPFQHPHLSGTFVTVINLHHNDPKSVVYIRFTLGIVGPMGWNKCIMTCMYHCGIIKSIFTTEKQR